MMSSKYLMAPGGCLGLDRTDGGIPSGSHVLRFCGSLMTTGGCGITVAMRHLIDRSCYRPGA